MSNRSNISAALLILLIVCCTACQSISLLPGIASKPKGVYHTVKKGQTLWRICKTYRVSLQDVAELNNIDDHAQIKAGDRLFIPDANKVLWVPATVPAAPGTTQQPSPVPTAPAPETESPPPTIAHKTGLFIWPLTGQVLKRFGIQNGLKHDGINIKGRPGSPIRASRSGKVIFSARLEGYGNTIILQHSDNYVTVYANIGKARVVRDQSVSQAAVIAELAQAPPDSCFLHFQIRRYKKARNPLFYLPKAR